MDEPTITHESGLLSVVAAADVDEHVFIRLDTDDRPTISIDVANRHGRRYLAVRANGMTIASVLCDVEELPPAGHRIDRFCPYCGHIINLVASVDRHVCPETSIPLARESEMENVLFDALGDIADVVMRVTVPAQHWSDESILDYVKNRVYKALETAGEVRRAAKRRG